MRYCHCAVDSRHSTFVFPSARAVPFTTAAFLVKNVPLDDVTIKFEIWDTAGQGNFVFSEPLCAVAALADDAACGSPQSATKASCPCTTGMHQRVWLCLTSRHGCVACVRGQ